MKSSKGFIFFCTLVLMLGIASTSLANVSLDGAVSGNTGNNVSLLEVEHTTGTGADRLMLVGVSWNCDTTDRNISSVTFTPDGESAIGLTEVITQLGYNTANPRYSAIYSLVNPPDGQTGTVTVTFSGSVSNGIVVGAANFAGVDQVTPLGPSDGANGQQQPPRGWICRGLTAMSWCSTMYSRVPQDVNQTLTLGADQAQLWTDFEGNTRAAASIEEAIGSSVTMSWTAE